MKKILLTVLGATFAQGVFAYEIFGESAPNANDYRIERNEYSENMFANQPSGGGTQIIDTYSDDSIAQRLFGDGTWNAWGGGTAWLSNPLKNTNTLPNGTTVNAPTVNDYAYGGSLWAQTGRVAGFAVGAQLSVANPWFANRMNGSYEYGMYGTMPSMPDTALNQLYLEYQYGNRVQADLGWITISDSPWLVPAAALGHIMPAAAYQGAEVTVNPGGGWILQGIGFNAAQLIGQSGFTGQNFYSAPNGVSIGLLSNGTNTSSSGTFALGANYKALNNNYNLRLWGYNFDNYGTLLYADTSLNMYASQDLSFNVALQGGNSSGQNGSSNGFTNNVNGTSIISDQISSNFAGAMASLTYDWAQLGAAYTSIWGPSGAFGHGEIVAPYTPSVNTDPMFSNSWNYNAIAVANAGQGTKLFAKFTFLDGSLWINPTYATYTNTAPQWNGTQEWDLLVSYSIPQIRGLNIFNVFIYEQMPAANATPTLVADQIVLGYTY